MLILYDPDQCRHAICVAVINLHVNWKCRLTLMLYTVSAFFVVIMCPRCPAVAGAQHKIGGTLNFSCTSRRPLCPQFQIRESAYGCYESWPPDTARRFLCTECSMFSRVDLAPDNYTDDRLLGIALRLIWDLRSTVSPLLDTMIVFLWFNVSNLCPVFAKKWPALSKSRKWQFQTHLLQK